MRSPATALFVLCAPHGLVAGLGFVSACKDGAPSETAIPTPPETGDSDPDTDVPTPVDTGLPGETGLDPCIDLALTPAAATVEVGGTRYFAPAGGTGAYRFGVTGTGTVTDAGIYGGTAPGPDTVVLEDDGCVGQATADVTVVEAFAVSPASARVPPGSAVTLAFTGGSGNVACALDVDGSGASLTGCAYVAGSLPGLDVIRVDDLDTGASDQVLLTVTGDAALGALASVGWMVPAGSELVPHLEGGSGAYVLTAAEPARADAIFDPVQNLPVITGLSAGHTTVTVRDAHVADLERSWELRVLEPHVPPVNIGTTLADDPRALSRDLDGDGHPELVLAVREVSTGSHQSGIVAIYGGTPDGPDTSAPIFTLEGSQDQGAFGKSVAFGDLDGDGFEDLVVGAPGTHWGSNAAGEVSAFAGNGTGVFAAEPFLQRRGAAGNERLGNGVGVCDVDGDGHLDLVASSHANDPGGSANRAGAVAVWRNGPTGLSLTPESRYGVRAVGGIWEPAPDGRMGDHGFAVGDFDHDGLCDVVAAIDNRRWDTDASGEGYVLFWSGDASEGLSPEPTGVVHAGAGEGGQLGRYLAVGDVDGSVGPAGLPDDVLIGVKGLDDGGNNAGGAFLFTGGALPAERTLADAPWSLQGIGNNDGVGDGVGITEAGDILIAVRGENRALRIDTYTPGAHDLGALPVDTLELAPAEGTGEDIRSGGIGIAAFGDGVVLFGQFDRELPDGTWEAVDARGVHGIEADGTTTSWVLGVASGQQHGRAVERFDHDGDGTAELIVASPELNAPAFGTVSGAVHALESDWVELGTAGPSWGAGDRRGWDLTRTDLDGTAGPDLVVAARTDGRPETPDLGAVCPAAGSRNGTGHLAVYLSRPGGIGEAPDLLWWPPDPNVRPERVAGGLDVDGDGFQDVLVGLSDDSAAVVFGAAAPPVGTAHELCRFDRWTAAESNTDFGIAVAPLGDLDGDGCDEGAIGSPREDLGTGDQGVLRVLWGYGPGCARAEAAFTLHAQGNGNARLSSALFGRDLDGDGRFELAVGGTTRTLGGDRVGDVLVASGAHLASFAADAAPASGGTVPGAPLHPILPPGGANLHAWQPSADFGRSVALGPDWIAVGMPDSAQPGRGRTGGITVYPLLDGVPQAEPTWWIGGETHGDNGDFGFFVNAIDDALLIGAPGSSGPQHVHTGAAYVAEL